MAEDTQVEPTRRERLVAYRDALYAKRMELLTGAQSYGIGTRSLARYNVELSELNAEIRRVERDISIIDGESHPRMKRVVFVDAL